jgi:hypothetical protein
LAAIRQALTGEGLPEPVPTAQVGTASEEIQPSRVLPVSADVRATASVLAPGGGPCSCGRPMLDSLTESLRDERALLVIDNFEHLLCASEILTRFVASCPDLKVLVTSRTRLQVLSEVEYLVKALSPGRLW